MSRPSIQCWNVARGMVGLIIFACLASSGWGADLGGWKPATFAHYVDRFNTMEDENFTNTIADAEAWDWMQKEIPLFECPDREVEEMYYSVSYTHLTLPTIYSV